MQVNEFQKKIFAFAQRWDKVRNFEASKDETFFHIVEEVGELARQYVNRESRKGQYSESEIKDAIGDTLMQLFKLANLYGWDVEKLILEIMEREEAILLEKGGIPRNQ